jgi:hypothetical protein
MTKEEVARALECSPRQVEKYAHDGRLGQVEYVKGKRGRQASYKPEEVERLKSELERERAEVIGHGPAPLQLAPRTPAALATPDALRQFAEMIAASVRPADTRPLLLTREEALSMSGLPVTVFALAVKHGAVRKSFKGHATRYSRDDVLALASREDLAQMVEGWRVAGHSGTVQGKAAKG